MSSRRLCTPFFVDVHSAQSDLLKTLLSLFLGAEAQQLIRS